MFVGQSVRGEFFFMILIKFVNSIRVELLMPNCCVGEKFMI